MREILFRGKRVDTKEWVYGYYFMGFTGIPYILVLHDHILEMTEFYEVIPETLGQFTGLTDKNGKKIFEGDILKRTVSGIFFANQQDRELYFEVPMISELYGDRTYREDARTSVGVYGLCEVAGNIYDNQELLP